MKKTFSSNWKSSKLPRKQRKYRAQAPLHHKHNFLSAQLSKPLREKYGKRSMPIRKGDEVLVMRGSFKKKKAKVTKVNPKYETIFLENLQRSKKDGTKVFVPFHPSILQIQNLFAEDKMRIATPKKSSKPVKEQPSSTTKKPTEKENAPNA
jgi:large subunit ribosomal protein L24